MWGICPSPPLRKRREEILPLIRMFLKELKDQGRTNFEAVSPPAVKMLEEYGWPGNVREIKSVIERLSLLWEETEITPRHLEFLNRPAETLGEKAYLPSEDSPYRHRLPEDGFNLYEWVNKSTLEIVREALEKHRWNKTETARYLGISRGGLYNFIKRLKKET